MSRRWGSVGEGEWGAIFFAHTVTIKYVKGVDDHDGDLGDDGI